MQVVQPVQQPLILVRGPQLQHRTPDQCIGPLHVPQERPVFTGLDRRLLRHYSFAHSGAISGPRTAPLFDYAPRCPDFVGFACGATTRSFGTTGGGALDSGTAGPAGPLRWREKSGMDRAPFFFI